MRTPWYSGTMSGSGARGAGTPVRVEVARLGRPRPVAVAERFLPMLDEIRLARVRVRGPGA